MQDSGSHLTPSTGRISPPRVVCLVGFMGSGKSTVGALLARQLAWRFEDLDARIEQQAGLTVAQIFERSGEPGFRELERAHLQAAFDRAGASEEPVVLALGGGTYAQPGLVEHLRASGALVIWLDCAVELLLARCATMTNRPLFRDEATFRALLASRLPCYQQADARVAGDDEPMKVVERVLQLPHFLKLQGFAEPFSAPRVKR